MDDTVRAKAGLYSKVFSSSAGNIFLIWFGIRKRISSDCPYWPRSLSTKLGFLLENPGINFPKAFTPRSILLI